MASALVVSSIAACTQTETTVIGKRQPSIENRQFTPELLWAMGRIGGYEVSSDEKTIAYNVSYYDVEQNKSHTVIYTTDITNKKETLLTHSVKNEIAPTFIENGEKIAFLSPDAEGKMQIWIMTPDGKGRKQISFCEKDVNDFRFSPDEKKIIIIHSVKFGQRVKDTYPDLDKTSGRVINNAMYRHWDEWVEEIPQPFIYDYDGKVSETAINILDGEPYECPMKPFGGIEQLAWSPDSRQIAYTCRKKTGLDYAVSTDSDIYLYDIESGKTINLCKPQIMWPQRLTTLVLCNINPSMPPSKKGKTII